MKFGSFISRQVTLDCQEGQTQTKVSCRDMNESVLVSFRAARIISELVGTYIVAPWLHLESLDMGLLRHEVYRYTGIPVYPKIARQIGRMMIE